MKIKKVVGWTAAVVFLSLVAIVARGAYLLLVRRAPVGLKPLAPTAAEAPKATPQGVSTTRTNAMPEYHWPPDFKLPLQMQIDAPKVPDGIQEPSPMPGKAKKDK